MDIVDFFDLLESTKASVVDEVKELIQEQMHSVKEGWLVSGLFDYYTQTNSGRCMEILITYAREPHDKFLIDKIIDSLRSVTTRKSAITFFGHLVRKQPVWLYKITHQGLIKELLVILKNDTDIVVLLTGLLSITTLLPIIPVYLIKYINEIFEIFGRLVIWTHTSNSIPEEHLLHLQVGLYSIFHRLYAMFPCNFLSYLRHMFGNSDKHMIFSNTIKPMLETVKMHPLLVTATKEGELSAQRWKNKDYDEIIAECALTSLDVLETGLPEEPNPINLRPRILSTYADSSVPTLIQQPLKAEITDLSRLANFTDDSSAPQTPASNFMTSASSMSGSMTTISIPSQIKPAISPPETAVEATPENTPIQTPVKDRNPHTAHLRLPTNSPAVKHLNFGKTPPSSIPSSPAPHSSAIGSEIPSRRDSIFDASSSFRRESSLLIGRLEKVAAAAEYGQVSSIVAAPLSSSASGEGGGNGKRPTPLVIESILPSFEESSTGFSAVGTGIGSSPSTPGVVGGNAFNSPITLHTNEAETIDDNPEEQLEQLKSVTIPMPDNKSLMAFAQRVKRLRFYSQCTDHPLTNGGIGGSRSTSPLAAESLQRSLSLPDIRRKKSFIVSPIPPSENVVEKKESLIGQSCEVESSDESTKTANSPEMALQSYEHLFEGVLPNFLSQPSVSGEGKGIMQMIIKQSPHHLLDCYMEKGALLHSAARRGDELTVLRGQVELLHAQLLFERHRREAHALRNRSLAKRCRTFQQQEEKNYSLEIQVSMFEKEISDLKKELQTQQNFCTLSEKEGLHKIQTLEQQVSELNKDIRLLKEEKASRDMQHGKLLEQFQNIQKELDQKKADIFRLENEIKDCKKYVSLNSQLKIAYETSQKEILLLGELNRRQQESLMSLDSNRYYLQEMEEFKLNCENEINLLKNMVEQKSSQTEAALGLINDLEAQIIDKERIISKQKNLVQDASSEYDLQIKSMEEKYESVKSVNHRLELEILNLQHQLTLKSYSNGRSNHTRRISSGTNGDSPHNSTNSDVDSATSAGGFQMSPEQSMLIFGSPQFGPTPIPMNDLHRMITESERRRGDELHQQESSSTSRIGESRQSWKK